MWHLNAAPCDHREGAAAHSLAPSARQTWHHNCDSDIWQSADVWRGTISSSSCFLLVDEVGPTPLTDNITSHSVGNQCGQIGSVRHCSLIIIIVQHDSVKAGPQLVVYVIFLLHLICRHNDIKVNHALRDSVDGNSPPQSWSPRDYAGSKIKGKPGPPWQSCM